MCSRQTSNLRRGDEKSVHGSRELPRMLWRKNIKLKPHSNLDLSCGWRVDFRYYVHVSEINAPPTTQIQVGMWFEFDVLPPKHPWQFPRAVNAFLIAAPKVGGLS